MKYPVACSHLGSSPCLGLHPWPDPSQFLTVLYLLLALPLTFTFFFDPKLNWVLVSTPAMGGVLQKASAGANKDLLQKQRAHGVSWEGERGVRGAPVCHHPSPQPVLVCKGRVAGGACSWGGSANRRSLTVLTAAGARLLPNRTQSWRER